jgi:hypothetical protein
MPTTQVLPAVPVVFMQRLDLNYVKRMNEKHRIVIACFNSSELWQSTRKIVFYLNEIYRRKLYLLLGSRLWLWLH